uniref:Hypothetical 12.8 kd protein n=1 Tax=Bacillus subtilis TaxID=1423 RepID=V9H1I8_BACIU|nr:hypothetical protein ygaH - Bacillus subtilis [Bacillus subtilis]CAB04801.1 hypothetical 12.8 kd protein [Bacillus subtilis subsp. subtilis str. 168]
MDKSPSIINKLESKTDSLKKIPMYIMINPTKTKLNANVLILLILLEYFAMSIPLCFNYSTNPMGFSSCFRLNWNLHMESYCEIVYNSSMCLEKRNFVLTIELNQIENKKI